MAEIEREAQNESQHASDSHNSAGGSNSVAPAETVVKMKKLKFNVNGEPIGEGSGKPSTQLRIFTRSQVPITALKWSKANPNKKEAVWTKMKEMFNFTDAQKANQMKKAGEHWRKYKAKLRKMIKGDTMDEKMACKPSNITAEDWYQFCVNESTPRQKEIIEKNKKNKNQTPMKSTHNTGRLGYARAEEKFIQEHGRKPLLVELWLYTHKRKNGTYAPHDQQYAVQFQQIVDIMLQNGQKDTIDSGPLVTAFGVNKRGRTRCVSIVISQRALLASSYAINLLQEIGDDRENLKQALESLHNDNADLKEQIRELVEGLQSGKFDVHGKGQSSSYAPSASGASHDAGTGPSSTIPYETRCAIYSHHGVIVAYEIKNPPGTVTNVHGRPLKSREVRVAIEKVIDPEYPLWGGSQFGCATLGDVGAGSYIFWDDDYLVPSDE